MKTHAVLVPRMWKLARINQGRSGVFVLKRPYLLHVPLSDVHGNERFLKTTLVFPACLDCLSWSYQFHLSPICPGTT